ncbi:hypothetical protein CYMTET_28042 [Cymbomonas tetramitiformis]|uniref:Uncharacterized protein n=1 Tax=Cymbomonas tetramitiformis TaxID=36881 RepID=A0AAE0FQ43_9CHLO|nr:hypothetical protein CYMTET_28042 [Cymbomonas tetramitiformis]
MYRLWLSVQIFAFYGGMCVLGAERDANVKGVLDISGKALQSAVEAAPLGAGLDSVPIGVASVADGALPDVFVLNSRGDAPYSPAGIFLYIYVRTTADGSPVFRAHPKGPVTPPVVNIKHVLHGSVMQLRGGTVLGLWLVQKGDRLQVMRSDFNAAKHSFDEHTAPVSLGTRPSGMLTAAWLLPCAPKYGAAFCQHDTEADILLELVDPASNKAPKDPAFMPYNAQGVWAGGETPYAALYHVNMKGRVKSGRWKSAEPPKLATTAFRRLRHYARRQHRARRRHCTHPLDTKRKVLRRAVSMKESRHIGAGHAEYHTWAGGSVEVPEGAGATHPGLATGAAVASAEGTHIGHATGPAAASDAVGVATSYTPTPPEYADEDEGVADEDKGVADEDEGVADEDEYCDHEEHLRSGGYNDVDPYDPYGLGPQWDDEDDEEEDSLLPIPRTFREIEQEELVVVVDATTSAQRIVTSSTLLLTHLANTDETSTVLSQLECGVPSGVTSVAGGVPAGHPGAGPPTGSEVELPTEGAGETHMEQPGDAAQIMVVPVEAEGQLGPPGGGRQAGANSEEAALQQKAGKGGAAQERETVGSRQLARLRRQSLETVVVLGSGEGAPTDHTPGASSSAPNTTIDVRRVSCREARETPGDPDGATPGGPPAAGGPPAGFSFASTSSSHDPTLPAPDGGGREPPRPPANAPVPTALPAPAPGGPPTPPPPDGSLAIIPSGHEGRRRGKSPERPPPPPSPGQGGYRERALLVTWDGHTLWVPQSWADSGYPFAMPTPTVRSAADGGRELFYKAILMLGVSLREYLDMGGTVAHPPVLLATPEMETHAWVVDRGVVDAALLEYRSRPAGSGNPKPEWKHVPSTLESEIHLLDPDCLIYI